MVVPAYPGHVVLRIKYNQTYFAAVLILGLLGVTSVVRMTTRGRCGKDNFRSRYDEKTNTNIRFLMFLFFALYHLMLSGNF